MHRGCSIRWRIPLVHRGYHEYIGGCSVHRGDIMIHMGDIIIHVRGYHEYIGGCSVHRGISWFIWGIS